MHASLTLFGQTFTLYLTRASAEPDDENDSMTPDCVEVESQVEHADTDTDGTSTGFRRMQ